MPFLGIGLHIGDSDPDTITGPVIDGVYKPESGGYYYLENGTDYLALEDAVTATSLWSPTRINTIAWYDFSDHSTITRPTIGSSYNQQYGLAAIDDKSGNGHTLIETSGSGPLGNAFFGYPPTDMREVMQFENDEAVASSVNLGSSFSIFLMMTVSPESPEDSFLSSVGDNSATNSSFQIQSGDTGPLPREDNYVGIAATRMFNTASEISAGTNTTSVNFSPTTDLDRYLFEYVFDLSSNLLSVYHDGVLLGTDAYYNPPDSTNDLLVGLNRARNVTATFNIGEIIITPNISSNVRQKIEGYLAHRWYQDGILDSSHPYKLSPPTI